MRRLGYEEDGQAAVNDVLARIDTALFEDVTWQFDPHVVPSTLNQSAKIAVSHFVCTKTLTNAKDFGMSITSFMLARDIIEWAEDLPSLSDIVSAAASTNDGLLLAAACDTVNLHAHTLAAIGKFQPLVDALAEHYITLRSQHSIDRAFIHALANLARPLSTKVSLLKLLTHDLALSEQQNSLAVCSPASDSLIGMHATTLDSDDDIDAVFDSGNTMD